MKENKGRFLKNAKAAAFGGLLLTAVLCSGFAAAFLLCLMNRVHFGFYLWPVIVSADVFVFTTIGFFSTEGKAEKMYGVCSILSAVCMIVQMAVLF